MSEPDTESTVKTVLAWGSVSYAFGFFTVTLHTARLGLPVIELIQPVYVWIGLPLAAVAFFSKRILQYFRVRSAELAAEFRSSLGALSAKVEPAEINLVAEMLGAISALPVLRLVLFPSLQRLVHKYLEPVLIRTKDDFPQAHDRQVRLIHRLVTFARLFAACQGFMNLINYALLLVLTLALYVWFIYPSIPQGIGGGKATSVRLVVEKDALPPEIISQKKERQLSAGPVDVKTVVLPATLLYLTKDFFFVDLRSGTRLSIKSGAIQAVEWSPKNGS